MSQGIGPIRSKSRTLSAEHSAPLPTKVYTYPGNVLISSTPNPSFDAKALTEEIHYSTRSRGDASRSPAYCRHLKRSIWSGVKDNDVSVVYQPSAVPTQKVEYYGWHLHSYAAHAAAESLALSSLGVNLKEGVLGASAQGMINQLFLDLRPDLTTVSLPNFLYEIGQLQDLFKLWKRNVGLAKNLAGARLNEKFGWRPTIGDLQNIFDGLFNVQRRIAEFQREAGVVHRRQKSILNSTTTISGTFNYQGDVHQPCEWSATVSRHVQGFLVYKGCPIQRLTDLNKALAGFLDQFGIELNPTIIWDAIPFSFVIDWFFNVGGFLDQFKFDTLELPIICTDCFLQYKEVLTIESRLVLDRNSSISNPETQCRPWVTHETFFHRLPILPNDDIVLPDGWHRPTTNQLINLVALAIVLAPIGL